MTAAAGSLDLVFEIRLGLNETVATARAKRDTIRQAGLGLRRTATRPNANAAVIVAYNLRLSAVSGARLRAWLGRCAHCNYELFATWRGCVTAITVSLFGLC